MVIRLELEPNRKNILLREENEQGFISFFGGIYSINAVSLEILKGLNNGQELSNLIEDILEDYGIEKMELLEDVKEFFYQLQSIGIISKELLGNYKEVLNEISRN